MAQAGGAGRFYDLKGIVQDLLRGFGLQDVRYCAQAGVIF